MTLLAKYDGIALPDGALLMEGGNSSLPGGVQGLPSSAWYGDAMVAGITVDDPDGAYDLRGWHTFTVDETDDTAHPRIFTGWINGKTISRADYKEGVSRIWECDIIDQNALFSFEVFRASSAKRPAETDIVRAAWAIASAPMGGTPVYDNGRANFTDNPRNFGDADYVTEYPMELFTSITAPVGKNYFAYWDDDAEQISLYYDLIGAFPASDLQISNVLSDQDGTTTFGPFLDARLEQDPLGLYTGELLGYRGAYVYARNQALIDAMSPTEFSPVEFRRDLVRRTDRIGELATANQQVQDDLAAHSIESDTITCMVRLPSALVNELNSGMKVDCKFTHLPGYEDYVSLNVIRRNVVPTAERTDMYDVHLELNNGAGERGPGGGNGTETPPRNNCSVGAVSIVQSAHAEVTSGGTGSVIGASWASPPTPGNFLLMIMMPSGAPPAATAGTFPGWTEIQRGAAFLGSGGAGGSIQTFYKIADSSEVTAPVSDVLSSDYSSGALDKNNAYLIEISGVDSVDSFTEAVQGDPVTVEDDIVSPITPTAGKVAIIFGMFEVNQATGFAFPITPMAGMTELYEEPNISDGGNPGRWIAYQVVASTTGTYNPGGVENIPGATFDYGAVSIAIICTGGADITCPAANQQNTRPEVVTLTGADGTTLCPFADGTLHVFIDNVEQTSKLVSQDGATGDFTLGFDPTPTEVCTVEYQGR